MSPSRNRVTHHAPPREGVEAVSKILATVREEDAPLVELRTGGRVATVPAALLHVIEAATQAFAAGEPVAVIREADDLTTLEAAALLGVSRPHFVALLNREGIPYHMVGTHRRIAARDLLAYKATRAAEAEAAFQALFTISEEAGLYDQDLYVEPEPGQDETGAAA